MAKTTHEWGPPGMRGHDEFGPRPEKRVERMQGFDVAVPTQSRGLESDIMEFFLQTGKKPTKFYSSERSKGLKYSSFHVEGVGRVGIDFIYEADEERLE